MHHQELPGRIDEGLGAVCLCQRRREWKRRGGREGGCTRVSTVCEGGRGGKKKKSERRRKEEKRKRKRR